MKKHFSVFILGLAAVALVFTLAYAGENNSEVEGPEKEMEFEVVEELPTDLKEAVERIKQLRGFGVIKKTDDKAWIYIGSGEQSTGGYSISVESVKKVESTTKITVVETSPDPDDFVTQALTYPHVVIKVTGVTEDIKVVNQSGKVLPDINDETKEADPFDSQN